MRDPANILTGLSNHSKRPGYQFERLYRIFFNEQLYFTAYQNIYGKPENLTMGADRKTVDKMSLARIEQLIISIKNESYQPHPSRRIYIPKKNGKVRPLGIPAFDDKLLQEIIRMVLEAIFEGRFEPSSHGFRPKKSCHTALLQVCRTFNGTIWFIEGDIKGFFDHIDHELLIGILKERITDDRFLRLIRKFLKAGYIENWVFHQTYSGTPQGAIMSPILANIYLDKLDKYMKEYILDFDLGSKRRTNALQSKFNTERGKLIKGLSRAGDNPVKKEAIIAKIKENERDRATVPAFETMDEGYRRLKYVRYADDFLIGVVGSLRDCQVIKEDIKRFLWKKLNLELSEEKTLITHADQPAQFLAFDVFIRKSNLAKRDKLGRLIRYYNKRTVIKMPENAVRDKLLQYKVLRFKTINGKERWKSCHRSHLINKDDLEILLQYNAEIRGFYKFYSIASNAGAINKLKYIMEYSMYKTFAGKYHSSVRKICRKYFAGGNFTVKYFNQKGEPRKNIFYNDGFKRKKETLSASVDQQADIRFTFGRNSLIERLKARKCELCEATSDLEMHHIRKLGDLKNKENKKPWEIKMIERQRKTMAVCRLCHDKIHHQRP